VLKKLFAPGLEQVLVFRDERLLRATSNAVKRGNRRYRKMQKTVDWGWTRRTIEGRPALDLLRERPARGRAETTRSLHKTRAAGGNDPISLLQSPLLAGSSHEPLPLKWGGLCLYLEVVSLARPSSVPTPWAP
jgi:hypothetical protein